MTSRDIAAKLFISERTVEAHVTNMLNKLGLNSKDRTRPLVGECWRHGPGHARGLMIRSYPTLSALELRRGPAGSAASRL